MMENSFYSDRFSYHEIAQLIPKKSRVLDLGCGNGELLELLINQKEIVGRGIDKDEQMIIECIGKGLSVFQGDLEEGLVEHEDHSYDYVILNQTLQMIHNPVFLLNEMLRVGNRVVVNFPNFGFFINRIQLGIQGKMPVNKNIPYEWYNTPNIHFCTRKDFMVLCNQLGINIIDEIAIHRGRRVRIGKSLFSSLICVVLEKPVEK